MRKIEFQLNRDAVDPVLAFLRSIGAGHLADSRFGLPDGDEEMKEIWGEELRRTAERDARELQNLFDDEYLQKGRFLVREDRADAVLRAASALRIHIRELYLYEVGDEILENGDVEILSLEGEQRRSYVAYVFLATLQELIIDQFGI